MDYPINEELVQRAAQLARFFSCSPMDFLPAIYKGNPQVWAMLEAFMNEAHEQQRKASVSWVKSFHKMA